MNSKVKDWLGIAGIAGIIAAAIVVWRLAGTYADSVQPGTYRSFSVSAEGKSVAIPDIATFTFQVITEGGKDLSAVQTKNTESANKAIYFLSGNGVDKKDIKTSGYSVEPRYQYANCGRWGSSVCPPPEIVGYSVIQSVSVKVRDLAKAGQLLGGAVANGANSVSQLNFTLDNPDSAKAAARMEALNKARTKAEEIAKEGGFGVGRLISIQINDGSNAPIMYGLGAGVAGVSYEKSVPVPAIEPGSQDVTVSVSLTYEIKS